MTILELIEKYEKDIVKLKLNKDFKELEATIQTVCVLREVIEDLKRLIK